MRTPKSQKTFLKMAAAVINADCEHPLRFLLRGDAERLMTLQGNNQNIYDAEADAIFEGKINGGSLCALGTPSENADSLGVSVSIDACHCEAAKHTSEESFAIGIAELNRADGHQEKTTIIAHEVIVIGGVPVIKEHAVEWEKFGLLPKGTCDSSLLSSGWTQTFMDCAVSSDDLAFADTIRDKSKAVTSSTLQTEVSIPAPLINLDGYATNDSRYIYDAIANYGVFPGGVVVDAVAQMPFTPVSAQISWKTGSITVNDSCFATGLDAEELALCIGAVWWGGGEKHLGAVSQSDVLGVWRDSIVGWHFMNADAFFGTVVYGRSCHLDIYRTKIAGYLNPTLKRAKKLLEFDGASISAELENIFGSSYYQVFLNFTDVSFHKSTTGSKQLLADIVFRTSFGERISETVAGPDGAAAAVKWPDIWAALQHFSQPGFFQQFLMECPSWRRIVLYVAAIALLRALKNGGASFDIDSLAEAKRIVQDRKLHTVPYASYAFRSIEYAVLTSSVAQGLLAHGRKSQELSIPDRFKCLLVAMMYHREAGQIREFYAAKKQALYLLGHLSACDLAALGVATMPTNKEEIARSLRRILPDVLFYGIKACIKRCADEDKRTFFFRKAIAILDTGLLHAGEDADLFSLHLERGRLLSAMGAMESAMYALNQAQKLAEMSDKDLQEVLHDECTELGNQFFQSGAISLALKAFRTAQQVAQTLADYSRCSQSVSDVGETLFELAGESSDEQRIALIIESESCYKQAIDLKLWLPDQPDRDVEFYHAQLSLIQAARGSYREAAESASAAAVISEHFQDYSAAAQQLSQARAHWKALADTSIVDSDATMFLECAIDCQMKVIDLLVRNPNALTDPEQIAKQSMAKWQLSLLLAAVGNWQLQFDVLTVAAQMDKGCGNHAGAAVCYHESGVAISKVAASQGCEARLASLALAAKCFSLAVESCIQTDLSSNWMQLAGHYIMLAESKSSLSDPGGAIEAYFQVLSLKNKFDPDDIAFPDTYFQLSLAYANRANQVSSTEEREQLLEKAISFCLIDVENVEKNKLEGEALWRLGAVYWTLGSLLRSSGSAKQAAASFNHAYEVCSAASLFEYAARYAYEAGLTFRMLISEEVDTNLILDYARQSLDCFDRYYLANKQIQSPPTTKIANSHVLYGRSLEILQRKQDAIAAYREAVAIYEEAGDQDGAANARLLLNAVY